MAAGKDMDNGLPSDTEGGEKPVREQLKKAKIEEQKASKVDASVPDAHVETTDDNGEASATEARGRIQRKRSFEEVEADSTKHITSAPIKPQHTRKRSRDSTVEEDALNNGSRKVSSEYARNGKDDGDIAEEANGTAKPPRASTPEAGNEGGASEADVEAVASPKTKRSRLHSTTADADTLLSEGSGLSTSNALAEKTAASTAESKADDPQATAAKIPPGSGFANVSASSPFGALAGSKSPTSESQTSGNAFASSGFGALAGSTSSGFGALGKTSGGPGLGGGFGTGGKSPLKDSEAAKSTSGSSFGGALGQASSLSTTANSGSAFGSGSSSGFGKLGGTLGGGFGSGNGGFGSLGGGGLTSFASGKPSAPLSGGTKPIKALGAAAEDDEEEAGDDEDDGAGYKSPLSQEEEKQDERFYAQDIETGEEGESTEMTCRAKLYNWAVQEDGKKEWRERGVGVLRLNVTRPPVEDEDNVKPTARLLMRADGSHRVLLNSPIRKELTFGTPTGEKPTGGFLFFSGTIDNKTELQLLQLKVRRIPEH